jgi:RNA polymerase sigma-70 factor (ECF subfamily)
MSTGRFPVGEEEERLLLAAQGDREAFAAFYRRQSHGVLAFFYRRTACPYVSADLTAETFAEALASIQRFSPKRGTATAWLYGIAGNEYRQWLRRGRVADRARQRMGIEAIELTTEDIERIDALVDFAPLQAAVTAALADLSPTLREAVVLRIGDDLTYEEVARRLGCSEGAARVRVSRGLARLQLAMEPG